MHDMGQPNHTYDADKLQGTTIWARMAKPQEYFLGLDGIERVMDEQDIVIADEAGTVGIGGVIGGGPSAVSETTKRLFLEAANFDPVSIRLTTKRHQLRTDASNRFEKSRSQYALSVSLQRYTELLREVIPDFEIRGHLVDTVKEMPEPIDIDTSCSYIRERIGAEIDNEQVMTSLTRLGFKVTPAADGDKFTARVPYYRATRDISIADDLVEEVGRTFGYENVPETAPLISSTSPRREKIREFEIGIADVLRGSGVSEAYAYSFENGERAEELGYPLDDRIELLNPVDTGRRHLRTSLVPGLIDFVERNVRYQTRIALFELGRSYSTEFADKHSELKYRPKLKNVPAFERHLLGIAYTSGEDEAKQGQRLKPALPEGGDFYAVKTLIDRVCRLVTPIKPRLERLTSGDDSTKAEQVFGYRVWMHPGRAAKIIVNDQVVGVLAEARPGIVDGLPARAVVAELDLELLLEADLEERLFTPLPKFPDSFFEMSVVMPQKTEFAELRQILEASEVNVMLRELEPVAVYKGAPLADDEKSVSVRLVLGSDTHTLGPDEIEGAQAAFISAIEKSSFSLRS
jgi:phenylalanyl-tRNA synthetase beta chain